MKKQALYRIFSLLITFCIISVGVAPAAVIPLPAVADFSIDVTSSYAPLGVQFTDISQSR